MKFRVLSFNIHGAVGRDGFRDLHRIARIVNNLEVKIAALQEVDSRPGPHTAVEQAQQLENQTGLIAVAGPTMLQDDRHYGNLLLTGYPPQAITLIDLSQPKREPRGAIDARLNTPAGLLRVVTTHLGLSLRERHQQIDQLFDHLSNDNLPTLFMGDFNEWVPGFGVLPRIHSLFSKRKTPRTYPSRWPLLALDRIWSRPAQLIESIHTADNPNYWKASDHRPLLASLNILNEQNES